MARQQRLAIGDEPFEMPTSGLHFFELTGFPISFAIQFGGTRVASSAPEVRMRGDTRDTEGDPVFHGDVALVHADRARCRGELLEVRIGCAMSGLPSPLKSPTTAASAPPARLLTLESVIAAAKVPSPRPSGTLAPAVNAAATATTSGWPSRSMSASVVKKGLPPTLGQGTEGKRTVQRGAAPVVPDVPAPSDVPAPPEVCRRARSAAARAGATGASAAGAAAARTRTAARGTAGRGRTARRASRAGSGGRTAPAATGRGGGALARFADEGGATRRVVAARLACRAAGARARAGVVPPAVETLSGGS